MALSNWTQISSSAAFGHRFLHSSVVYDNKIYVLDGSTGGTNGGRDIYASSDAGSSWDLVALSPYMGRYGQASVVLMIRSIFWVDILVDRVITMMCGTLMMVGLVGMKLPLLLVGLVELTILVLCLTICCMFWVGNEVLLCTMMCGQVSMVVPLGLWLLLRLIGVLEGAK